MEDYNPLHELSEFFLDLLYKILDTVSRFVSEDAPQYLWALAVLVVGWAIAAFLGKVTAKLLKALGLDVFVARSGLRDWLLRRDVTIRPSRIAGSTVYWILVLAVLVNVLERLQLTSASRLIRGVASHLPDIFAGMVVLGIAWFLGKWLGGVVARALRLADVPFSSASRVIAHGLIFTAGIIITLARVGLAHGRVLLSLGGLALFSALTIGVVLAVFLREDVSNFIAGRLVVRQFRVGDRLALHDVHGEIVSIGSTSTALRTETGTTLVPHRRLTLETVEKLDPAPLPGESNRE